MNIDRSSWGRIRVTGGDRVRFLQGLTTVNVEKLAVGAHGWGAVLNPKGRVLVVIDVARVAVSEGATDEFVLACQADTTEKLRTHLDRYAVMDDVEFTLLEGPAHQAWTDAASVWTAPIIATAAPDALDELAPAAELLRVHAGFPRYGVDVSEDHFPFETVLAQFLDYKKGCYIGQEPVFRVHAQGQAAKSMRGLAIEGTAPLAAGTGVKHATKDNAGVVTSSVVEGDQVVALAYVHKSCWEPGGTVTVDGRTGTIHALPW